MAEPTRAVDAPGSHGPLTRNRMAVKHGPWTGAARAAATLLAVWATAATPAPAGAGYELTGRVIYVDDGDTLVLLTPQRLQEPVRLASIDAPETAHTQHDGRRLGQPYAARSKEFLEELAKGQQAQAKCFERDIHGRSVCDVFVNERSLSEAMVANGWAWVNVASRGRFMRDNSLPSLEASARASAKGLWAGASPVPPWQWRAQCWRKGICPGAAVASAR